MGLGFEIRHPVSSAWCLSVALGSGSGVWDAYQMCECGGLGASHIGSGSVHCQRLGAHYLLGRCDPIRRVQVNDVALAPALSGPHNIQHLEPLPVKVPERPPLLPPLAPVLHRGQRWDLLQLGVHHCARHTHLRRRGCYHLGFAVQPRASQWRVGHPHLSRCGVWEFGARGLAVRCGQVCVTAGGIAPSQNVKNPTPRTSCYEGAMPSMPSVTSYESMRALTTRCSGLGV